MAETKKLILASSNKGKIREIKELLPDYEILSMAEAGFEGDIEENGTTFEENAMIKARTVWEKTGHTVLADDSGLEVDAINKEPGIYSARYLGEDTPFDKKMDDVLRRLEGVPQDKRTARFVCAMAAVLPDGTEKTVRGTMEGFIGYEKRGTNGFGYDPIFVVPEYDLTVAELDSDQKNKISHRGMALKKMKEALS
ncbi:MAG: XTP/dITP diphosphatase [Lachnospiraceae bacterium]|nr:XTP/dITP diphosphatase [Lachnospiraceae bacterium]